MSPVFDNGRGWNNFLAEILKAKDDVERLREQIIRHCTMTSATLIGLIAAFVNVPPQNTPLRWLTILSVSFLFLTVVVGVLHSFLYISLNLKALQSCLMHYQEVCISAERNPVLGLLARVFPWLMCIGVFSLFLCILLLLL